MTDAPSSPAAADAPASASPGSTGAAAGAVSTSPGEVVAGERGGTDDLAASLLARIYDRTARVLIVGQGYVGLPVSMRAVEVGFPVVGLEEEHVP